MQRRIYRQFRGENMLVNARDRIIAMGTVYRHLYQADTLEYVEFSEFLNTIAVEARLPMLEPTGHPLKSTPSRLSFQARTLFPLAW